MQKACFRILPLLLVLCLIGGCGAPAAPTASTSQNADTSALSAAASEPASASLTKGSTSDTMQIRKLYADYLQNGGYAELMYNYDDPDSEIEAEACFADVNGDSVPELLLHLTNKSFLGVRGYYAVTALLGVQNGKAATLAVAEYGGGSGGGDYLSVAFDTQTNRYVLVYEEFVRDGMFFSAMNHYYVESFRQDDNDRQFGLGGSGSMVYAIDHTLSCERYALDGVYAQDAERVKAETDLYVQEDEYTVTVYQYDDAYIPQSTYDAAENRYVTPTDPAYQMQPVTLQDPIPAD